MADDDNLRQEEADEQPDELLARPEAQTGEGTREDAEAVAEDEPPSPPSAPPSAEELKELREKAAERDEYLELAKRAKADFVNYQKRMEGERKRWAAFAQRDLLARLLTACDHCSVAAKSAADDCSVESLRDAITLVWSELERFLKECGVSGVPTEGSRFDPDVHEAVLVQPSTEHPDSTVLSEVKPGYVFGQQVLRPAQVVVTRRPPEEAAEPDAAECGLEKAATEDDNVGDVE